MRCVNVLLLSVSVALLPACSAHETALTRSGTASASKPEATGSASISELHKAEYSLRWRPTTSLATADDVAKWLRVHAHVSAVTQVVPTVDVRYFVPATSAPEHSSIRSILRRRGESSWTFKVRGTDGVVPSKEAVSPGCEEAAIEGEWDVSLDATGLDTRRTASLGCDGEGSSGKPGNLAFLSTTHARPCLIQMERTRLEWPGHNDIKIERWTFRPSLNAPETELLEVSWKGKATTKDEGAFRNLIHEMPIGGGDRPASKEELAEACDARS